MVSLYDSDGFSDWRFVNYILIIVIALFDNRGMGCGPAITHTQPLAAKVFGHRAGVYKTVG